MAKDKKTFEGIDGSEFIAPVAALLGAFTNDDATFGAKGGAIGGGVGAGLGALVGGPLGAQVGNMLGSTVGQLIGSGKDKRLANTRMTATKNRQYGELNLAYNANPYGSGSTFYAEDGLVMPGAGESMRVNIEKDELLVDPSTMSVVQSFDTKRYKRHAKDKSNEHVGNFIEMDASHVIIPRKKADAFKNGDRISRRSIIAQIMEDQENNGVEINEESVYAQNGIVGTSAYRKGMQQPVPKTTGASAYRKIQQTPIKKNVVTKKSKAVVAVENLPDIVLPELPNQWNANESAMRKNRLLTSSIDYTAAMNPEYQADTVLENFDNSMAAVGREVKPKSQFAITNINKKPLITNKDSNYKSRKAKLSDYLAGINLPDINPVNAAQSLNFLPTALGLIQAGQNDPFLQYDENGQIDAAKAMIAQMPIDENTEAARAAIAQGQAGYLKQMRNVNSPSTRAEVADYMLKSQTQAGTIEQDKENRRTQRIGQKLGMLADMEQKQGGDRLQARNKFALESSQDRAVRQNMIHSAVSEGAVNFGKLVMDKEKIKNVNAALKYNKANPGSALGIEEDQDAVMNAIAVLSGTLPNNLFATGVKPKITNVATKKKDKLGAPAGSSRTRIVRQ